MNRFDHCPTHKILNVLRKHHTPLSFAMGQYWMQYQDESNSRKLHQSGKCILSRAFGMSLPQSPLSIRDIRSHRDKTDGLHWFDLAF